MLVMTEQLEVLIGMEDYLDKLSAQHDSKRKHYWPAELLECGEGEDVDMSALKELRANAAGIPDVARINIAMGMLTEEGLPMFHGVWATKFPTDSAWARWLNLWTAEEDRHGNVLRDYCRDTRILNMAAYERVQFGYLRKGRNVIKQDNPYKLICYASVQERLTQLIHDATGKMAGAYEPRIKDILHLVAMDEARHHAAYAQLFGEILRRDPMGGLRTAAEILGGIDMPSDSADGFSAWAEVLHRSGAFDMRMHIDTAERLIKMWGIADMTDLGEQGRKYQERIMNAPRDLTRIARMVERRQSREPFRARFEILGDREVIIPPRNIDPDMKMAS